MLLLQLHTNSELRQDGASFKLFIWLEALEKKKIIQATLIRYEYKGELQKHASHSRTSRVSWKIYYESGFNTDSRSLIFFSCHATSGVAQ